MMPSGARVKPRESMDRTSKGRNCSGKLGPKIKDVLSMIESQSWQWLTSKDWGNNLWKNGDFFLLIRFKGKHLHISYDWNKVENLFGGG